MALPEIIAEHARECAGLKSQLPEGPWTTEPDRFEFKHRGLDCLAIRQAMFGFWCGYVAVPKGHVSFGVPYQEANEWISIHGGLTYSDNCQGVICHSTDKAESIWWFGFDCGHAYDFNPRNLILEKQIPALGALRSTRLKLANWDVYRDLDFVKKEIQDLADQLAAAQTNPGGIV